MLDEKLLQETVERFYANKTEADYFKKIADKDNTRIKEIMIENGINDFETPDLKVTCSTSERLDFVEEALMAYLKENEISDVIKTKEYVDMDALENAIYHGKVKAHELASCQTKKEVITLRVTKLKK